MPIPDSFCIHAAIHPQDDALCEVHKPIEFDRVDVIRTGEGPDYIMLEVRLYIDKAKLKGK